MRRVDEERAPIHVDEVHDVDLAGGMVRVGAAGDVPLGPGSELALVARRKSRSAEIDSSICSARCPPSVTLIGAAAGLPS